MRQAVYRSPFTWAAALLLLVSSASGDEVGKSPPKKPVGTAPVAESSALKPAIPVKAIEKASEDTPAADEVPAAPDTSVQKILRTLASGEEIPEELRDPGFDYYVDLGLLGTAWGHLDAGALADVALQFVEGERVLLRTHNVIRTDDLLAIAMRLSAVKHDEATLSRLATIVKQRDRAALTAQLAEAQKMLTESPQADPALTVAIGELNANTFTFYKGCLQDIDAAIVVQDPALLLDVEKHLVTVKTLPADHRAKLQSKLSDAKKSLPEGAKTALAAAHILNKLAAATRRNPYMGGFDNPTVPDSPETPATPATPEWPDTPQWPPGTPQWPDTPDWPNQPPWTPPTIQTPPASKYPPQQQQQQWIPPSRPSKPGKYPPPGKGQSQWNGGGYYPPRPWWPPSGGYQPGGGGDVQPPSGSDIPTAHFTRRFGGW